MRKYLFSGLIGILLLVVLACGGDAAPTSAPAGVAATKAPVAGATKAPLAVATQPPVATATPSGVTAAPASASLKAYADAHAGGPGAIYAGDITQLVGLAPVVDLGGDGGMIPLEALQSHMYIYEGEYYQNLLKIARLTNPTELVSSGESITLQHACINRTLGQCRSIDPFWVDNLAERTNGQLTLQVTSFPELGIAGPDTISLVRDGTLGMVEIYTGYVAGELPEVEIMSLWGAWPTQEAAYLSITDMHPELDEIFSEATDGGVVVSHQWVDGVDQFIWSQKPLDTVEAFQGLKTRSHSSAMSDWIEGMGASAQFVAFAEVYTALERGILDAGVTGGGPGLGQRWYEVSKYLNGPLPASLSVHIVVNKDVWNGLPADLQQILIEEGAKAELEGLRDMAILDTAQFVRNIEAGLEFVQLPPEVLDHSFHQATIGQVIPAWINRVGLDNPIINLFNEKVGPLVGISIAADGSVSSTRGAAAGPAVPAGLRAYADANAGGPGAIWVGDNLDQLVGPAPAVGLGGFDDEVPLDALQNAMWIYESDYYNSLPAKAKLLNPTALVTSGEDIQIQHACINRTLLWCKILEAYFVPNLLERTNGQLEVQISSFPELGLSGSDTMSLVTDGVLAMVEIYGGYVGGEFPAIEVQYLWGVWPSHKTHYLAQTAIFPDIQKIIRDATGAEPVFVNWIAGDDQFFFSDTKLTSLEDFKGLKTRSHSAALSDWIEGMGADAQFVAFAEVYTALERGILDAGVTGASPGFSQRWYEVAEYMNGRLFSFNSTTNVVNEDVWNALPADFQQIMYEEGAKAELEALRLGSIQNEMGVARNVKAGLELVEFSQELKDHSFNVSAMQHVIPAWINRVGGTDEPEVALFNEKVGPLVGLHIEPDGTVVKIPITK